MKKQIIILVVICFALSVQVNAQVASVAASATADSIITKIRNSLSEVISEAEASGSALSFSVATDANILLQNLDIMADKLTGKLFRELNSAQQAALSNALQLAEEANRDLRANITALDSAIKALGTEISRIPGVDERPLVTSYEPSYILNNDAAYDILLQGSLLNSKKSELLFGDSECKLVSSVENQARFRCPAEIFSTGKNEWASGILTLSKSASWYQFWKEDEIYNYTIGIMVIQEQLGEYSITVFEQRNTQSRANRTGNNSYRNDHCKGGRSVVWTHRPASGCQVDVSSINASHTKNSNSTYEGVINPSSNGFQVRGVVRNDGNCGPFGVPKDGRGSLSVSARWVDVCPASEEVELNPEKGQILWLEDKVFQLPNTMTKFVLTLNQKNKAIKIVNGATSNEWFITTYDPSTKILILKPREIADALK